jgi:hypothetical protein
MSGLMVVALAGGMGVGFCLLVARALWQWQGWWRWALAAPILLMIGVILDIVVAIWQDSTAHNLWPIELLFWFTLANALVAFCT